jgi:hypothetical protein
MNLQINKFKGVVLLCLALSISCYGQKQSKRYTEKFSVNPDVTIDINTSYTDIEFDTWNKNSVEIEAVIEIEDISKEEAEKYFKAWNFEAMGNSDKVEINTKSAYWFKNGNTSYNVVIPDMDYDFNFVAPDINVKPFIANIPKLPPLPPMPPMPHFKKFNFDYEAYKKDGDKYLDKWKKEFEKSFDKDFKIEMKKWKEEMEKHKAEHAKFKKEFEKEHAKMKVQQKEEMAKMKKELAKTKEFAKKAQEKVRAELNKNKNILYLGADKNLKIKRTIKIKMPKGAKLKMNVRHGEVKLAENVINLNATLSHTRLLAQVVDGSETRIKSSYAPVIVEHWNQGELQVNYAKNVALKNVKFLELGANSSNVIISNLINRGYIQANLGSLHIDNIANEFSVLDVGLNNTDTVLVLPKTAYAINANGLVTTFNYPKTLQVKKTKDNHTTVVSGFNQRNNTNKKIEIKAKYSNVVMQ